MNKPTKITLGVMFGVMFVILIVLLINVVKKEKLEQEYEKYRFEITDVKDVPSKQSEYELVIEYCIKNNLSTSIVSCDATIGEGVPEFIEGLGVDTYYICYLQYEPVFVTIIEGEIISNLEEVKRYFE